MALRSSPRTVHQRDHSSDFKHTIYSILYVLPSSLDAHGCPRHDGSPPLAQYCAMWMHCVAFSSCCLLCRCRLFFGSNPPRSLNVGQPNVHGNEHDHPLDAEQHPPPGRHPPEPRQPFLKVHLTFCQTVFEVAKLLLAFATTDRLQYREVMGITLALPTQPFSKQAQSPTAPDPVRVGLPQHAPHTCIRFIPYHGLPRPNVDVPGAEGGGQHAPAEGWERWDEAVRYVSLANGSEMCKADAHRRR